jgi:hypothetical protein
MGVLQATSNASAADAPIIANRLIHTPPDPGEIMTLLLLEALGALLIFVFIIWWTMFSGRKNGELKDEPENDQDDSGSQPRK